MASSIVTLDENDFIFCQNVCANNHHIHVLSLCVFVCVCLRPCQAGVRYSGSVLRKNPKRLLLLTSATLPFNRQTTARIATFSPVLHSREHTHTHTPDVPHKHDTYTEWETHTRTVRCITSTWCCYSRGEAFITHTHSSSKSHSQPHWLTLLWLWFSCLVVNTSWSYRSRALVHSLCSLYVCSWVCQIFCPQCQWSMSAVTLKYIRFFEAAPEDCKTETSVVIERVETSELVQHKLARFTCLLYDRFFGGETKGSIKPLVDKNQLTTYNNCGENEDRAGTNSAWESSFLDM